MRIIIANDQPKIRFALRVALERQPGFKTISEASDAKDLLTQAQAICPDLAIIEWGLPDLPMAELIGALRNRCGNTHVIILSGRVETRTQALAAGANEFISMCDAPDELLTAIDRCFTKEQPRVESKG